MPIGVIGLIAAVVVAVGRGGVLAVVGAFGSGQRAVDHPPALPPSATVHPTPLTAGARSTVRLVSTTSAPVAQVLEAFRRAAQVRGNFFLVWGDAVAVEATTSDGFICRTPGSAVFQVRVEVSAGTTRLRVGGFDRYRTSRQYVAGFIPAGPATVQGFRAYKVFLAALAQEVHRLDPGCRTVIGTPEQAPLPPSTLPPRQPA